MDLGALIPIVIILSSAVMTIAVFQFILRMKTLEANAPAKGVAEENERLNRENGELRLALKRMEERLAVLERIATDPAERTAREIESLR